MSAYDLPRRVETYDADMEVMHPNRARMVQVAVEVLPFATDCPSRALDLGVGTGYFAQRFLQHFPCGELVGIDAAQAMLDLAEVRLASVADRADLRLGDFRYLGDLLISEEAFDVVFSSYALHHLNRNDKQGVVRTSLEFLRPGGWLLNADLIVAEFAAVERRIQELRVRGIVRRAGGRDARFQDALATRRFLDEVEQRDGDQPHTVAEELQVLREAGAEEVSLYWLEYREAVWGGRKGRR